MAVLVAVVYEKHNQLHEPYVLMVLVVFDIAIEVPAFNFAGVVSALALEEKAPT